MRWIWCQGCGELRSHKLVKRARRDRSFGVCSACITVWESAGKICTVCDTPIEEVHTLAFLTDRPGFSHEACGGVALL